MKNQFFSFLTVVLVSVSLISCGQKRGCMVRNNQTGVIVSDNDCNGIPDVLEGGVGVGSIIFYGEGIITNVSGTSSIGYYNGGNGFALTYPGSTNVSTQYRLMSFKVRTAYGLMVREAILNQDLVPLLQASSGELAFTNLVVDAFDRKDVTAMQQYLNSDQKVLVPEYVAVPESNPVWMSMGSNTYNQQTGQLNGRPVHYEIIGFTPKKVNEVFRIQ